MLLGGGSSCQKCGCGCACPLWDIELGGNDQALETFWLGAHFYTGPSGGTIKSIQLRSPSWSVLSNRTSARLSIWSTVSNEYCRDPNSLLHLLDNPTTYGADPTFTTSGYTVSAESHYWVILQYAGTWSIANALGCLGDFPPGAPPRIPYCQECWVFGNPFSWYGGYQGPYVMKITGEGL
jgi:hypothetical protein